MDKYVKFPTILLVVGFCESGKSYAIQYTVRTTPIFDFVVVISSTAKMNDDYGFLKELGLKHRVYDSRELTNILDYVMKIQEKNIKEGNKVNVLIILDDVMGALQNSKVFARLASCYRHFLISLIISTQYCNSQTTYIRELASYIYVFDQRTEVSMKAVYQSYFNDVGSFQDFKRFFARLNKYEFFFINRGAKTKQVMKCPPNQKTLSAKEAFMKNFNN